MKQMKKICDCTKSRDIYQNEHIGLQYVRLSVTLWNTFPIGATIC